MKSRGLPLFSVSVLWGAVFLLTLAAATAGSITNPVAVLTHHNDLARTGANLQETDLNTQNVNSNQFGLICTRAVDDVSHVLSLRSKSKLRRSVTSRSECTHCKST